jgi:aryl-alcohol dehydrogenase-like predicted oxidoreductase
MRYRPFGTTGLAVSSLSLALTDVPNRPRPQDWTNLIYLAMEHGINTFEVVGTNPAILDGMATAVKAVERHLLFIALRLGNGPGRGARDFSATTLVGSVEAAIARTGIEYLDLAQLDDPGSDELPAESLAALKDLRARGRARHIGVAGVGEAMDAYISTKAFDVLTTPYSLVSGWRDRRRLKAAQERDMPVIAYDFHPPEVQTLEEEAPPSKSTWFRKAPVPLSNSGSYAFLNETAGWTPEEICLAFSLTEPSAATVQITTEAADRIPELAAATEKDLPSGVSSRIEMARFGQQSTREAADG